LRSTQRDNVSEIIEKLERNARFYESEAAAMKPEGARHLGPQEAKAIAILLTEAIDALMGANK
jgi:hypothetical protein